MRIIISAIFLLTGTYLCAQDIPVVNTQTPYKQGDSIYVAADFPGGTGEWMKYLERNLHPEIPANHRAPAGTYIVVASFEIDTAGNVIEVNILQDPGFGTGKDVEHLLKKSPKWLPATINGKPVIYHQKQNFTYQVSEQ
jgi:periplasmic protein TonB